jgi:uncharacterized protein YggE
MRLIVLALGAVVLATAAVACTDNTTIREAGNNQEGISVSGTGTVLGEPDIALVTLGVEADADSVGEARTRAAEAMDGMIAALKDGGVADEDLQTTSFSVQPRYDYTNGRATLLGFTVTNRVTAKIRNIDDTGDLVDAAIVAGGNLARVDNLVFTIDDSTALQEEARRKAVADARSRAETLADAGGVELGDARAITESGDVGAFDFAERGLALPAAADLAASPIQVGELEVRVDVQVVFDLK